MSRTLGEVLELEPSKIITLIDELSLPICKFLSTNYPEAHVRREALKRLGVVFADNSSFVNMGFTLIPNSPSDVHLYIGKNVSIAPGVTCVCSSSANNGREINSYARVQNSLTRRGDIRICDEAWIGANVTILPGVTVGHCSVVGAGCVLSKDTEDFGIYAGVPGRKIGDVRYPAPPGGLS